MSAQSKGIDWYRTNVSRDVLRRMTSRSDGKALAQATAFLLIYAGTTSLALHFFLVNAWIPMVVAAYVHSVFTGFVGMGAAVHELSHGTAFKTKWLNEFFYRLFCFLTWNNPHHFRESHKRHHLLTGYKDVDKEILPEPIPIPWWQVVGWFTFDFMHFKNVFITDVKHAFGFTKADFFGWTGLFDREDGDRKKLIRWARFLLIGHAIIAAVFIYFQLWILLYTFTFGYFFATFLVHGCEIQQHAGLPRDIPDWRVVATNRRFGPLVSFLYWGMSYHAVHHMYAAVPFYNLKRMYKEIHHDFPEPMRGYWRGLLEVVRLKGLQRKDPTYRYIPEFPESATPPKLA